MKKLDFEMQEISAIEYEKLNERTRVIDDNVDANTLINISEFLLKKKVLTPYKVNYPREKFIYNMITRIYKDPDYIPAVKEFLESDYFSNLMKKAIYDLTSTIPNCERINRLLKGDMHMNDFPASQLFEIRGVILNYVLERHELTEYATNSYIGIINMLDEYMFFLDGLGPVNYVKGHYDKNNLLKNIIIHSGLQQKNIRNYDRVNSTIFNEKHILSIYNKIKKYIPEASEEFIKLVDCMNKVSPYSFINSLYEFADNRYSCDNLDMFDDNITFDDFPELESEEQINIKNAFIREVGDYQKVLTLGYRVD